MYDGSLERLETSKLRFDLDADDVQPVNSVPYQARPTSRQFSANETDGMLNRDLIEPTITESEILIVFPPKNYCPLSFFVAHRKLNTVTVRDCYPLLSIDDCIKLLGKAHIFSTLNGNLGYWWV